MRPQLGRPAQSKPGQQMNVDQAKTRAIKRVGRYELKHLLVIRYRDTREIAEQRKHDLAISQRAKGQLADDHRVYADLRFLKQGD